MMSKRTCRRYARRQRRYAVAWLLTVCLPGLCAAVAAQDAVTANEPQTRPELNRPFAAPVYDDWVARFERSGREVFDRRLDIVAAAGVASGMHVADIGAGTGLFTYLFADRVGPTGKVYAVDISRVFIDNLLRRSAARAQTNVTGIVNRPGDAALPPASIDLAFICDTYHHFERPLAMMRSIRKALRPGGGVVVVDFRRIPGFSTPWVMGHVRVGEEAVIREIESAGFRLVEQRDFMRGNYFLRFEAATTGD